MRNDKSHRKCLQLAYTCPMRQTLVALLFHACGFAAVTDFQIFTSGPHHVVQGHYVTFNANGKVLAGTDDTPGTVPSVSSLPPQSTASFPNMVRYCCGTYLYQVGADNPVRISVGANTPPGSYTVQIKYVTPGMVTRTAPYTIIVDPVPPAAPPVTIPSPPLLAGYDTWKSNAAVYGKKHCTAAEAGQFPYEGAVWYYDGPRVYYQIADLMADRSFEDCAALILAPYQKYITDNAGAIPGYRVFGRGLALRAQRASDTSARQALSTLRSGSPYGDWPNAAYIVDWSVSREVSFSIDVNYDDQSLGGTPNSHLQDTIEALFGDFDQWFASKSSSIVQPFMVALAAEGLIGYFDKSQDTRVLPALKMAADQLWTQSWNVACQCFLYYNDPANPANTSPAADLNGLIAPLYGWVYKQTGITSYRDKGDQIFNGSAGAWLDGGKQFSQTYRWSGKYVEWRGGPGTNSPTPTPNPTLTLSCSSGALQFSQTGNNSGTILCR